MKAIMISIKPKWCAKIMNGEKTIEVRKNKALASAIQKLIDENGYADIYVYCTKEEDIERIGRLGGEQFVREKYPLTETQFKSMNSGYSAKGKVVFKFRCYKVEEWHNYSWQEITKNACLSDDELRDYSKDVASLYCVHISNLEIFDRTKELSEFKIKNFERIKVMGSPYGDLDSVAYHYEKKQILKPLTKAPQNFCYVGVE